MSSPVEHVACSAAAIDRSRALLFDWDGCLAVGSEILPEARRLLRRVQDRTAIISNNSSETQEVLCRALARVGVTIPTSRIIMAGVEAIRWVSEQRFSRVMLVGSVAMARYARGLGVALVQEDPDIVLLLRDPAFTYTRLQQVVTTLANGAQLVAANADRCHPGANGLIVPETGALLAAIRTCLPAVEPIIIGKPGPMLFDKACAALDAKPAEAIMIGDNPETDGAGAQALGIPTILVGADSPVQIGDLLLG